MSTAKFSQWLLLSFLLAFSVPNPALSDSFDAYVELGTPFFGRLTLDQPISPLTKFRVASEAEYLNRGSVKPSFTAQLTFEVSSGDLNTVTVKSRNSVSERAFDLLIWREDGEIKQFLQFRFFIDQNSVIISELSLEAMSQVERDNSQNFSVGQEVQQGSNAEMAKLLKDLSLQINQLRAANASPPQEASAAEADHISANQKIEPAMAAAMASQGVPQQAEVGLTIPSLSSEEISSINNASNNAHELMYYKLINSILYIVAAFCAGTAGVSVILARFAKLESKVAAPSFSRVNQEPALSSGSLNHQLDRLLDQKIGSLGSKQSEESKFAEIASILRELKADRDERRVVASLSADNHDASDARITVNASTLGQMDNSTNAQFLKVAGQNQSTDSKSSASIKRQEALHEPVPASTRASGIQSRPPAAAQSELLGSNPISDGRLKEQFQLAEVYRGMGDFVMARSIYNGIIADGSPEEVACARTALARLE
jgi:hypothetical protein